MVFLLKEPTFLQDVEAFVLLGVLPAAAFVLTFMGMTDFFKNKDKDD